MPKRVARKPDIFLAVIIFLLIALGLVALFSASTEESQEVFGNIRGYLQHQLVFGVFLGLIAALAFYLTPYTLLRPFALPIFLMVLFLLIFVFIPPFSRMSGGAQRWIEFGGISLQPSEVANLGFIIYLAAWIEARRRDVKKINEGLIPFLILVGILGFLLILQPDMGTLGVIALTSALMYVVGGGSIGHLAIMLAGGTSIFFILIKTSSYRFERLLSFFNSNIDPLGISYQINQALLAVGSGGLTGLGIGYSQQKYTLLPEPMGDSIFAVWGEETGFIGGIIIVALFLLFIWRGLRIARGVDDRFASLLAIGITIWIGTQAFINM